jgi:hypothetical protein
MPIVAQVPMLQMHQGHTAGCLLHEQFLTFVEAAQFYRNMRLGHVVQTPVREDVFVIISPRLQASLTTSTTVLSIHLTRTHFEGDGGRFAKVTTVMFQCQCFRIKLQHGLFETGSKFF